MNELIRTLQDVPVAALVPLTLAVVIGLTLWSAGRRILRLGFCAIGLLIGLSIGWLLGESFAFGIPSWATGLIVGVVMAAVAVVLYRAALASSMAVVLAVACPMATVAMYEMQGHAVFIERDPTVDLHDQAASGSGQEAAWWERPDEFLKEQARKHAAAAVRDKAEERAQESSEYFDLGPEIGEQLAHIRSFGAQLIQGLRSAWDSTAERLRPTLIAASVGGAILGFVLGALLPGLSAAIVTAFGGSLLWITAVRVLTERLSIGDAGILPTTGRGWITFWLVAALIGLGIQWMIGGRRADKSG